MCQAGAAPGHRELRPRLQPERGGGGEPGGPPPGGPTRPGQQQDQTQGQINIITSPLHSASAGDGYGRDGGAECDLHHGGRQGGVQSGREKMLRLQRGEVWSTSTVAKLSQANMMFLPYTFSDPSTCEERGFRFSMSNCMFESAFEQVLEECNCYPVFHSEYYQGNLI